MVGGEHVPPDTGIGLDDQAGRNMKWPRAMCRVIKVVEGIQSGHWKTGPKTVMQITFSIASIVS